MKRMSKIGEAVQAPTVLVTRHSALLDLLAEKGVKCDKVLSHAKEEDVTGCHVIGILPLRLAAEALSITEATLEIPPELRGEELSLEQLRKFFRGLTAYTVTRLTE